MTLLRPLTAGAMCLAAAPAGAQTQPPAAAVADLLPGLDDPATRERAVHRLAALDAAALPALLDALESERTRVAADRANRYLMQCYALGCMRQRAEAAVPRLLTQLRQTDDRLQQQLLWTLAEISPFGFDTRTAEALQAVPLDQPWLTCPRDVAVARFALGKAPSAPAVAELPWDGRPIADWIAAARAVRDGLVAAEPLVDALESAYERATNARAAAAARRRNDDLGYLQLVVLELAEVLMATRRDADGRVAVAAELLAHADSRLRLRAAHCLLVHVDRAAAAVAQLVAALDDDSRPVVREALVALSLLDPPPDSDRAARAIRRLRWTGDPEWLRLTGPLADRLERDR